MADLLGSDRADAGKTVIDRLCERHRFGNKSVTEHRFRYIQRIQLAHRVRDKIVSSGKDFTHRAHLGGDMLDTVQDHALVIAENDVAVFAHDFYDQRLPAKVTHLIQMLNIEMDDPFQLRLTDRHDPSVSYIFSEQHTEIRCRHGTWFIFFRQIDQRKGGACGNAEPFLSFRSLDCEQKLVGFRLGDFIDSSV